jgi:hypothetical protein
MLGASKITSQRQYILLHEESFNTNGNHNFTIPKGTVHIEMECWGGGGGGAARSFSGSGRSAVYYPGAGGGGGGYTKKTYYGGTQAQMQQGDFIRCFVGAEGYHETTQQNDGNNAQESYIGTHQRGTGRTAIIFTQWGSTLKAFGGQGGQCGTGGGIGGAPGYGVGGDINTSGETGASILIGGSIPNNGGDGGAGADPNGGAGGTGGYYNISASAWVSSVAGITPGGGGGGAPKYSFIVGASGGTGRVTIKAYG